MKAVIHNCREVLDLRSYYRIYSCHEMTVDMHKKLHYGGRHVQTRSTPYVADLVLLEVDVSGLTTTQVQLDRVEEPSA